MTHLLVNPGVWLLLVVVVFFFGLVGVCIGTPGKSSIKRSLMWCSGLWGVALVMVCVLSIYEDNGLATPEAIEILFVLTQQSFVLTFTHLFYAIAEKNRGLHFTVVHVIAAVSAVLHICFDYFHAWEGIGRVWLPAVNQVVSFTGCIWFLARAYRSAAAHSTRRKRITIVFLWLFISVFLGYLPTTVAGETLGFVEDKVLVAGFVQFFCGIPFALGFGLLVTRYNLVKVELDQLGEGLFRDIDSPVLLLSEDLAILRANPKADETFDLDGLSKEPSAAPRLDQLLPEFTPGADAFDVALQTRLGPKEYACKLSNVYQMDEVLGSILVFHDVTRARELARMKTEFTSTVSHELRTPLTSILGFAKIIERRFHSVILPKWVSETKKEERAIGQIAKNLGVIISESNRLTKLINDVLDISKMEAGKMDWNFVQCDSRSIIEQALNATNGLFEAKPSVELIQELPAELPEVVADSDRVVQVVINLISNAVKFTDSGRVRVQVEKKWSSLFVLVHDEGTGISPADQKLVFEKYKQVGDVITDKPTGTGLGLPISKEIVEMHGGKIWVESTPGRGSTFGFSLPLATVVDTGLTSIDIGDFISQLDYLHSTPSSDATTVLVIDDDTAIRDMVAQMLEEEGYQTLKAVDGMDGLEQAREAMPDVIILDVMMPRLNGFDCAAALKGDPRCRHIPIIMLTVLNDAQRAFGLGVDAYLTKPFEADAVMAEVKRLLDKRAQPRRVVVLGQREDSQSVLDQLKQTTADTTHLSTLSGLEETLHTEGPDLALVVGTDFQEEDVRLQIQRLVGTHPCLLIYIDPK